MTRYRTKPEFVEAITFEELVEVGKSQGVPLYNGLPWSFEYQGHAITHEDDDCYLVPTPTGTAQFKRGEMLLTGDNNEIFPCPLDLFNAIYEKEEQP